MLETKNRKIIMLVCNQEHFEVTIMKETIVSTSLKSMINIEILKAAKAVDSATEASEYYYKIKEYKRARKLKELASELNKGNEYVLQKLEELSSRSVSI
jgi:hypothetical protein